MRVTASTEALTKALNVVGVATDSRTLPVLGSVMIEAKEGALILSATNLDIFITERIEAEVEQPGVAVVAHRLLAQFMGRATSQSTTLEIILAATRSDPVTAASLVVKHGDNTGNFECLSAEDFPPNLDFKEAKTFVCDAINLLNPFKKIHHAISHEESRYELTGISIKSQPGGLEFAATDSRRLAIYKSELKLEGVSVIVPDKTVLAVIKAFQSGEAKLSIQRDGFGLATQRTEIRSRVIEGSFPKYNHVVPEPSDKAFSAQRKDLIEAVTTASLFLTMKEIAVKIRGAGKEVEVSCYDRFKAKVMGSELSGQPELSKHVNHQFLLDAFNVMEEDQVRIEVSDSNLPITLREGAFTEVINSLAIEG